MTGTFLGREPVAIAAFLAIVIDLAISFGLNLTVQQVVLLNALIVAGLGLIVRQTVYSPTTVKAVAANAAATGNPTVNVTPP